MSSIVNSKFFLWLLLALPWIWVGNGIRAGDHYYGEVIHLTGELSARLMMLSMAVTPLRLFFSGASWPNWLLQRRRYFGVAAFAYAALHTVVYVERKADVELILAEAMDFAMWTGWIAFVIFVALAATSNDASVKRLRRAWKKLHRWVYLAALLTFAHWIFSAFDFVPGLIHLSVMLALESYRLWKRRTLKRAAAM